MGRKVQEALAVTVDCFGDSVRLVGTVNLSENPVLHYVPGSAADGAEYLIAQTFDQYDGTSQWTSSPGQLSEFGADANIPPAGSATRTVTYTITYDAIGGSGQKLLLAPGAEASLFSVPSVVTVGKIGGADDRLAFTISAAERAKLCGERLRHRRGQCSNCAPFNWPGDATGTGPLEFTPGIISQYVQPGSPVIAPEVKKAAQEATKGTNNMYDAATALEDYLRTFKYSTKNDDPPAGSGRGGLVSATSGWVLHLLRLGDDPDGALARYARAHGRRLHLRLL